MLAHKSHGRLRLFPFGCLFLADSHLLSLLGRYIGIKLPPYFIYNSHLLLLETGAKMAIGSGCHHELAVKGHTDFLVFLLVFCLVFAMGLNPAKCACLLILRRCN